MRKEWQIQDALSQALLTLMEEKNIQSITVREIAEKASLSTRTFYNHYRDKYDFVSSLWLTTHKNLCTEGDYVCSLDEYFFRANQLNEQLKNFYIATLGAYEGQNSLWETMFDTAVAGILWQINRNGNADKIDDEVIEAVHFYVYGLLGIAKAKIKDTMHSSGQSGDSLFPRRLEVDLLPEKLKRLLA
jgi:AcrR family transcriptional regulator